MTGHGGVDLSGRRVLVTGGTRGIGAAIVEAAEAAGAQVLVHGTRAEGARAGNAAARAAGFSREYLHADFADPAALAAFCDGLRAREVDVLINNAGVNRIQTIEQLSAEDYDWLMAIDLRAPLLLSQSVAPGMRARGWGRIVNVASIWSVITKPGRALYTAAKAGLAGLTRTLAVELAPHGVLVNTISPGFTRTELTASTLAPEEMVALSAQVPARRFAEPAEIAQVALFLASPANTYLTGQNIVVDGGFTCV
jgi:NAD(P)-dependent dehydrogenase (short-subunit alcohol dehydrogenase family)